jgi:hypothetical protein
VAPDAGLAIVDEDGFLAGGGGEIAELGAGELDEGGWLRGAAEALEVGEDREESGGGGGGGVELDLDRDGVADDGGGEVGREDEAKHGRQRRGQREFPREAWPQKAQKTQKAGGGGRRSGAGDAERLTAGNAWPGIQVGAVVSHDHTHE